MNYTQNYHLPQWEETDRIMRTDFNEAMAGIEEGITEAKEAAAEKWFDAGWYTGLGQKRLIKTGFRPRFLIITSSPQPAEDSSAQAGAVSCFHTAPPSKVIEYTDNGFYLTQYNNYPDVNIYGHYYGYVAFR